MASSMRCLAVAALVFCSFIDRTNAVDVPPQAPEPTSPARIRALRSLYERADGSTTETLSITVAPDNICGFYTPNTEHSFTCTPGTKCMWENVKYNVAFCGERDFKTGCMNSVDALNIDKCDEDCRRNTNIEKCTANTRTECYIINFPNNIEKHACHTKSGYTSMMFPSGIDTYEKSSLQVAIFPAAATSVIVEASSIGEPSSKDTAQSETARPTTTVTGVPQGEAGEDSNTGDGKKSNVGAIAGGVVGGVALIVGAGLAIFFILRRDRKKKQAPQAQMVDQTHTQPQTPYGMAPQQQQQQMYPQAYQDWPPASPPPGWQQSPSPPTLQHPSAPVLVEAPGEKVVQIHEIGSGKGDT
ncbi:Ff.00g075940.m01.CDS01 [Fusarium sp. VM40]|nr:Ff.00g075940.m01.CDS01 [Fusarium sp. VM40]